MSHHCHHHFAYAIRVNNSYIKAHEFVYHHIIIIIATINIIIISSFYHWCGILLFDALKMNGYFQDKKLKKISSRKCYDRALLPSIICLGRLRIASKNIFNLWQLRQRVDSLAQWLEHWIFNREDRVRFPGKTEYFFSYASFLCYGFHVVRKTYRYNFDPLKPHFYILKLRFIGVYTIFRISAQKNIDWG